MLYIKDDDEGVAFRVFILPKSSKNIISGLHDDAIKIKLTAPPVDGAANKLCIKFLSKCLKIPKSFINVVSGHTGRKKMILLKFQNDINTIEERKKLREKILLLIDKKR